MNEEILDVLEHLRTAADVLGETYREKAYARAIVSIKQLDYTITLNNLKHQKIPGVGQGISEKITQFLTKGYIPQLRELMKDKKYKAYVEFSKIAGVGPATIKTWINSGIYNIKDLRKAASQRKITLNKMQTLGLRYYKDLNSRISRDEASEIIKIIKYELYKINSKLIIDAAGSYRRLKQTVGDIDILITDEDGYDPGLLEKFLANIQFQPGFIDVLSSGTERVIFLFQYAGIIRQVDILNVQFPSFYFSLLYNTGDREFNIYMRAYCAKVKNLRLNQNGLYSISGKKMISVLVPHSEKEIFDYLGLKYIEPRDRTGDQIVPKNKH